MTPKRPTKPAKPKAAKAWAIVRDDGTIQKWRDIPELFARRWEAVDNSFPTHGDKVTRVLITPVTKRKKGHGNE